MRDQGIAYGFTKAAIRRLNLHTLSPQIISFIDKNPSLLHEDANVSWLLEQRAEEETGLGVETGHTRTTKVAKDTIIPSLLRKAEWLESRHTCSSHSHADCQQGSSLSDVVDENEHVAHEIDDNEEFGLSESFRSWLVEFCEGSMYPTFELGSLAFIRSPGHQALMDHLDELSSRLLQSTVDAMPVHSLSANMFLPKQSVWNFRDAKTTQQQAHQQKPTAVPLPFFVGGAAVTSPETISTAKQKLYAHWQTLARDIRRQSVSPGLISGNTVQDWMNDESYVEHIIGMRRIEEVKAPREDDMAH